MNYSDFGVSCAEELEQDEWSLSRPTFKTPKGGVLTVIGHNGKKSNMKRYIVYCNNCASDPHLFGEAVFSCGKESLTGGSFPCGCSKRPKWNQRQQVVRVERLLEGTKLSFIGFAEKYSNASTKLLVSCGKCSHDRFVKEGFCKGVFITTYDGIKAGTLPCRCSPCYKWSHQQQDARMKFLAEENGLTIIKKLGSARNYNDTKFLLSDKDGNQWSCSIQSAFFRKTPLAYPGKNIKVRSENSRATERDWEERFLSTGKFVQGTTFKRLAKRNHQGVFSFWEVFCPVCADDDYSRAGLCNGTFISNSTNLSKGQVPCRCNTKKHNWTEEQQIFRISPELEARGWEFLGWVDGYRGSKSKFYYKCPHHPHHKCEANISSFLSLGRGCPLCSGKSQKQAYLHAVQDGEIIWAVKFGISNDWEKRLYMQNYLNAIKLENLGVWEFSSVKTCKLAEKECKMSLQTGVVSKNEMPDGWSETTLSLNIEKVIAIYEKHGGKRIK